MVRECRRPRVNLNNCVPLRCFTVVVVVVGLVGVDKASVSRPVVLRGDYLLTFVPFDLRLSLVT